jgi:hypothetical protein
MSKIDARAYNLKELLGGKRYFVDTFQREYRWREEQINALVSDLTGQFLGAWRPDHLRTEGGKYPSYFMGSVIISGEEASGSVIDGQQRLTSLTLLLIWLYRRLPATISKAEWERLIFTETRGQRAFALDVPERTSALDALLQTGEFATDDSTPESVRNIVDRFEDIEEAMPDALQKGDGLVMFADWLIENVFLVSIRTSADEEAYAIFETMNDRGLALSETDMLKGYVLSKVADERKRGLLNGQWKKRINDLIAIDRREESIRTKEGEAIKAWLRAQHAETIRLRERDAKPGDFDRIGTEFHRWVKDQTTALSLKDSKDFERFVERDFDFYTAWYLRLRRHAEEPHAGYEAIFCNADIKFTLQYPLMMAPIEIGDSEEVGWRKAKVVAAFVDILINRRIWNGKGVDYNAMQYAMFETVLKKIRRRSAEECAEILTTYLASEAPPFSGNPAFGLLNLPKKTMRRYLARMTAWLDVQAETAQSEAAQLKTYLVTRGRASYDIEHVIPDTFAKAPAGYASEAAFEEGRNRIGALLLLEKSINRSLRDRDYPTKRAQYAKLNMLAKMHDPEAAKHNPALRRLLEQYGFSFVTSDSFDREQVEQQQAAYLKLAEAIWSPDRLWAEAGVSPPAATNEVAA